MPDKTPLELARNVLDYVESRIAKDLGTCQPGTFCANAGIVAAALIERMTPVVVENQEEVAGVCGGCVSWVERGDKFCPNCGVPLSWT